MEVLEHLVGAETHHHGLGWLVLPVGKHLESSRLNNSTTGELGRCKRHDVGHITGIARNPRTTSQAQEVSDESRERHEQDRDKHGDSAQ